jgi:hypothetical protein
MIGIAPAQPVTSNYKPLMERDREGVMGKAKILQFNPQWRQQKCGSIAGHFVPDADLARDRVLPWRSQAVDAVLLDGGATSLEEAPAGLDFREEVLQIRDEVAETIQSLRDLLVAYAVEQSSGHRKIGRY